MSSTGSVEKDGKDVSQGTPCQPSLEISSGDESIELTPQELHRLKRIVDWRILPYMSLLFFLSAFGDLVQRILYSPHTLAAFVDFQVSSIE